MIERGFAVILAMVLWLGPVAASEMARPFGEPTPKFMQTMLGFFIRHTEPDKESGGSIPRLILSWNSPLFTGNPGRMRLFFGGTFADGEVLVGSDGWVIGVGGFAQPVPLTDREYLSGIPQTATEVERSSYAGRVMFGTFNQDAAVLKNTEILFFYSWGYENFRRRDRAAPTFVLPNSTQTESWGFSFGFDDAWETKAEGTIHQAQSLHAPPEHSGSYLHLLGIWTKRLRWDPWGLPTRFDNADTSNADYPKIALAAGMDQTQVTGDQVNFSFAMRAGWGEDLDRFSAFRLGGGTNMDRDLNRAPLYGYHFEEFLTNRFVTVMIDFGVRFDGLNPTATPPPGTAADRLQQSAQQSTAEITRFHIYYQHAWLNEYNLGSDRISKQFQEKKSAGVALTTSVVTGVYVRADAAYGFDALRKDNTEKGGMEFVLSAQTAY